ncbi:MAG: hypothetical protein ACI4DW_02110 [Lachnospiraceae bacterium]
MSLFSGIFGNHGYTESPAVSSHSEMAPAASASARYPVGTTSGSLTAGQTIEGRVIESDGKTVQIDIGTGTPVTARLDHAMELQKGQNVVFEVKANSSQQLTLSPLYTNLAQSTTALRALNAANMPVNASSLAMTSAMMDAGMNIDRSTLSDMYRMVSSFPDKQPSHLIQMHQMGIEINEQTVEQFTAFKNYEQQVGEGMRQIAADIPAMYEELLASGREKEAAQFMKAVVTTFLGEQAAEGEVSLQGGNLFRQIPLQQDTNAVDTMNGPLQAVVEDGKIVDGAVIAENGRSVPMGEQEIPEAAGGKIYLPEQRVSGEETDLQQAVPQEKEALAKTYLQEPGQVTGEEVKETKGQNPIAQNVMEQTKSVFLELLQKTGVDGKQYLQLKEQPATIENVMKMAKELFERVDGREMPAEMKKVMMSDGFKNVLQQAVQNQWFLKPEEVADKSTVESLYRRLEQQTRQLTEALSQIAKPESALSQDLSNMNQNMNFMHQMNQVYQYIQLPLKMHGGEATGDLFVYSDRKSLAQKDGNVSALLHLSMNNLGNVDVYASMSEGNNVFTRFYLESDELLDFIGENIHILDERLESRGYHLKTEMTRHGDQKDLILETAAKTEGVIPQTVAKYSFDMRA